MGMGVFTRTATWTLDGQAGMSMQGDSPEYEYRRRLQVQSAFMRGGTQRQRLSCAAVRSASGFHAWRYAAPAAFMCGGTQRQRLSCVVERRKAAHECLDKSPMGNNFSVLHRAFIAMTRYKSILF